MEQPAILQALPHGQQTARDRAKEHGESETTNDVATIMGTVSRWDQNFAVLTEDANRGLTLRVETDLPGVQRFYEDRVRTETITAAHGLKKVQTSWYSFNESIGDVHRFETSRPGHSRVAVVFPTWTDGIIGELLWEPQFSDPRPDWQVEARIGDRLDAFDTAWLAGDPDAMLSHVRDETYSVMRVASLDGHRERVVARSKAELREAWRASSAPAPADVALTNRVVSQFYAFTSYRLIVQRRNRRAEREVARLLPVDSEGAFIGELSYAVEVELPD